MRRKILAICAIGIILSIAAYGSIAYFTAQDTATNVITSGNVIMELHDETTDGEPFAQEGLGGVMPGDAVDKIVFVENIGDNAFYSRIKLLNTIIPPDNVDIELSFDCINLNINTQHWSLESDGWYYYQSKIDKGSSSEPLFTKVTFEPCMGNDYMNANVEIEVIAQAVQCANNGDTVQQATGWPAQ